MSSVLTSKANNNDFDIISPSDIILSIADDAMCQGTNGEVSAIPNENRTSRVMTDKVSMTIRAYVPHLIELRIVATVANGEIH